MEFSNFDEFEEFEQFSPIGAPEAIDIALHGTLRPAPPGKCPKCATEHEPELPHNHESMYWHYWFYQQSGGRWPTLDDAMAHCTDEMKALWLKTMEEVLANRGETGVRDNGGIEIVIQVFEEG